MHHAFRSSILLSALALPLLASAQTTQPAKVDIAKVRAKLLAAAYIEGKLTKINEEEKVFTFQYVHQVKKPIPKEKAKLDDITRRWNQALQMRNTGLADLEKMQKEARAILKAAYEVEETPIDFELKGDKSLAVRTQLPPVGADGKPRKLTPAEDKKLKGDTRLPGYIAPFKDLDTKGYVRVYIDKKAKPPAKEGETVVYPLTMIVIVPEPKENDPFVIPGS